MIQALIFHFNRTRKFGWKSLFFYIALKFKKNKLDNIKLSGIKHPITLSNIGPDLMTLFQIFFAEEYSMPFDIVPKNIIDCGANIGLSAIYYANKYPDAKIIAIEPDKGNFQFLQQNTKLYPNIVCVNKAVWYEKKRIQLVDIGTGNWSLQTKEVDDIDSDAIEAISITEIMREFAFNEIDILKVDIEGAERELFSMNVEKWIVNTKSIAIELHPNIHENIPEIFNNAIKELPYKKYFKGENLICDLRSQTK